MRFAGESMMMIANFIVETGADVPERLILQGALV
jgi:hypothetical protein